MSERLPLSLLIDRLAGDGPRDEAFVRAFCAWFAERAPHIRLELVERLGLTDVVVTFRMKERVRMVVTGYPPDDLPGEVTVSVDERDFPGVWLQVSADAAPDPYEICTLDYGPAGQPVEIVGGPLAGQRGTLVVAATVGERRESRVRLDDGRVVTVSDGMLRYAE